jgi:two-component system CheB/CheR fusion protein
MAERVLNLMPSDVGRPITHIKPNIKINDLEALIRRVVDEIEMVEREVQDEEGRSFSLRLRPYKNIENQIDGAVLSLFEITATKRHEQDLAFAGDYAEALLDSGTEPVAVLDGDLRVESINRAFALAFDVSEAAARGALIVDLIDGVWERDALQQLVAQLLDGGDGERELDVRFPEVGSRRLRLTALGLQGRGRQRNIIVLTILPPHDARGGELRRGKSSDAGTLEYE